MTADSVLIAGEQLRVSVPPEQKLICRSNWNIRDSVTWPVTLTDEIRLNTRTGCSHDWNVPKRQLLGTCVRHIAKHISICNHCYTCWPCTALRWSVRLEKEDRTALE